MATKISEVHFGSQILNSFMEFATRVQVRSYPVQLVQSLCTFSELSHPLQQPSSTISFPCWYVPQFQGFLLLGFTPIVRHKWLTSRSWLPAEIGSANPLDLSQLKVDLRSRHLAYWRRISSYHARDLNSKKFNCHHCALPTKNAHATCSPYILPQNLNLGLNNCTQRPNCVFVSLLSNFSKLYGMTPYNVLTEAFFPGNVQDK
eukprot:240687-Pelagomonas_calceolata.AAC.1